jgi:hypothetical protein
VEKHGDRKEFRGAWKTGSSSLDFRFSASQPEGLGFSWTGLGLWADKILRYAFSTPISDKHTRP